MSTADDRPSPGRRLGDFEVVREIGRGGMGVVYEARQTSLGRKVALKVLAAGPGLTAAMVRRFHQEAEAAAKLHHTNVVPVYSSGEQGGSYFYSMELVEGPSLDLVLRRLREARDGCPPTEASPSSPSEIEQTGPYTGAGGATSPAEGPAPSALGSGGGYFDNVARMLAAVADALEHAHQQGIIHRDVKPSNLLLSPDGRLSLTDFGLARLMEQPGMTLTGEFVGTPAYMSPEQITAGRVPVDHRTDIYSLGATLYEMLTLRPPFTGSSRDQVLAQIIQKDPPRPRDLNPAVPADLETICLKCLEKDPDRRYRTAGELAEDLRRYVSRFAIRARRAGPLARLRKWASRNPALAWAAAAVMLALCAAGFFAWQARQAELGRLKEKQEREEEMRAERRGAALQKAVTAVLNGQNDEAERQIDAAEGLGATVGEVRKVRGIIALYQDQPAAAFNHLQIAATHLGSPLAVKALLAKAAQERGDSDWDARMGEILPLQPRTAEDFLFKGMITNEVDDPREGVRLIEEAIRLSGGSPLAQLALAEALALVAIDTGAEADSLAAVQAANAARVPLGTSTHALAACIYARLCLWDVYRDRRRLEEEARCRELIGRLVEQARGRYTDKLRIGCRYYHICQRRGLEYARELWGRRPAAPAAGEGFAFELYRAGSLDEAKKILSATSGLRGGSRSFVEWYLSACIQAEAGRADVTQGEIREASRTMTPGQVLNFPTILACLGKMKEAGKHAGESLRLERAPGWHKGWYQALAGFQAGDLTERQLLTRAGASRLHLCEAHFHIACFHMGRGQKALARDHLKKAVETRVFLYVEHELAGLFLDRMKDAGGWPTWVETKK